MDRYETLSAGEEYLRSIGVQIANNGIANLLVRYPERAPRTVLIHGRRLTTKAWLDEWVQQEAARPARRRDSGDSGRQERP